MTIAMPETTDTFANLSLVVLTAKPADLAAVTITAINGGENISCHEVGDWWATATTDKVSRARKMCQRKVTQRLGSSTWETPALQYTANPQTIGTPGSDGNEAYEALPEGVERYLLQRIGIDAQTALVVGDAYLLWPVQTGPQVWGASQDDAGGEAVINQDLGFAPGYDGPIFGVVAAAA